MSAALSVGVVVTLAGDGVALAGGVLALVGCDDEVDLAEVFPLALVGAWAATKNTLNRTMLKLSANFFMLTMGLGWFLG